MKRTAPAKVQVDPARPPGLRITQVYLAHAHFKYRADPLTISPMGPGAEVSLRVDLEVSELENETGNEIAGVRVRVQSEEGSEHPYIFDVSMGAIVEVEGNKNFAPRDYVVNSGAALLFPFVREVIANLSMRGRFGPIWIPPFNIQLINSPVITIPKG